MFEFDVYLVMFVFYLLASSPSSCFSSWPHNQSSGKVSFYVMTSDPTHWQTVRSLLTNEIQHVNQKALDLLGGYSLCSQCYVSSFQSLS